MLLNKCGNKKLNKYNYVMYTAAPMFNTIYKHI